jgi:RNA recognition motif-containing protein
VSSLTILTSRAGKGDAAAAPTRRPAVQMPDEYLPPNKILFVQNLPDGTTHARLSELFGPHPGLHEVRMIPTKKDIAFVEFVDEAASAVAKDALHNFRIDGEHKIKVRAAPAPTSVVLTAFRRRSPSRGRRSRRRHYRRFARQRTPNLGRRAPRRSSEPALCGGSTHAQSHSGSVAARVPPSCTNSRSIIHSAPQ